MIERTFAVVLVPLQKQRDVTESNVAKFKDLLNLYDDTFMLDQKVYKEIQTNGDETDNKDFNRDIALPKRLKALANVVSEMPFFKRIPKNKILRDYVPNMTFRKKEKDDLVIIPPGGNKIVIILNGQVVLREHELSTPGDFKIQQVAKCGHILFVPELDEGNSCQPLVWPVVYSQKAQIAIIDRPMYELMWKDSRNRDLEVTLSQLNLHLFFKTLSRQSFFKLINEKSRLVSFKPGQLVMPIHSRSPWNNMFFKRY